MTTFSSAERARATIADSAKRMGLDTGLMYETLIDLTNEGMLTARCVNAATMILLTELGLPEYYFRHISRAALRRVLQVIARNIAEDESGRFTLSSDTAHLQCNVEGQMQVLTATAATRDYMESVVGGILPQRRWEYYHNRKNGYVTYIIKPEKCRPLAALAPGESVFAFAQVQSEVFVPEDTYQRYEAFLARHRGSVTRLVEFSDAPRTGETRLMFHKTLAGTSLPVLRQLLADHGLTLNRAYGETYRARHGNVASVCSLYIDGTLDEAQRTRLAADLRAFLALAQNEFADLYVHGTWSFREVVFAVNASFFLHQFMYKAADTDRVLMESLKSQELRDALARRISEANRSEYSRKVVNETMRTHPELLREIFAFFDRKHNPARVAEYNAAALATDLEAFRKHLALVFTDDSTGLELMAFLCRLVTHVSKTNFYKGDKRSFAFRLDREVLDPVVFSGPVYAIFFVVGHFALGTHMRAEDISRGGLRLLRVTPANYENELDNANLLNFALGPKAQRLKHKDIAESGAKGVIVPTPGHAGDTWSAVHDYSEGILDLTMPSAEVVDHYGRPEMIFFGPDEGTAHMMDAIAGRARQRGYKHWRTITSGKAIGVPHDAFGRLQDGRVFALTPITAETGTELAIEGRVILTSPDPQAIRAAFPAPVASSGMTTTGVMATCRTVLERLGHHEHDVNLMMTGGPDGDLGGNQILCFKGRICLIVDGGGVLFDPDGLDRAELAALALCRHLAPRPNAAAYPRAKLGPRGFLVERSAKNVALPDGTIIEDGSYFHKTFLTTRENRRFIAAARIDAFIPCGGFKDTVNFLNVRDFLAVFAELRVIVEGANVFFDDTARGIIAAESGILQIRDSTANKGGVTSSSLAEVLTGFLLGDDYEALLVEDMQTRFALVRALLDIIEANARNETAMLLNLHQTRPDTPLYMLSVQTSEQLLALQQELYAYLPAILADTELLKATVAAYVPAVIVERLGAVRLVETLGTPELRAYRDALVTKKLAAAALYAHAAEWDGFRATLARAPLPTLRALLGLG